MKTKNPNQKLEPQVKRLQEKIDHIVVLMLENRSFDNLLGWLYAYDKPSHGQEYEGLNWDLWNPLNNVDADGIPFIEKVPIEMNGQKKEKYGKPVSNPVDFTLPSPDPGEGYKDTNFQLFSNYEVASEYPPGPTNFGFVNNYQKAMLYGSYSFGDDPTNPRAIMKCYTPEQTPVLSALARNFAVCDHYHASVPSQTLPNRSFVHAATSDGSVNNSPNIFTHSKTIYNQIDDAILSGRNDLSWKIFGNNFIPSGKKGVEDKEGKFGDDHFSLTRLCMTSLHGESYDDNFGTLDEFIHLCKKDKLPSYSFLEPTYGGSEQNDQHPPTDIRHGEQLIAKLYKAISQSKKFNETLFIITHDEHGGCFDHIAPPGGAKNPDSNNQPGQDGFLFNRFGVRVPCVVINPHIKAGLIARPEGYVPYDHTSIIKTVQTCFQLKGSLNPRNEEAPDLSGVLTLSKPRANDFPKIHAPKCDEKIDTSHENDLHQIMKSALEKLSGIIKKDEEDLLTFIQDTYKKLFVNRKNSKK